MPCKCYHPEKRNAHPTRIQRTSRVKTNGDYIRGLTDEALAELASEHGPTRTLCDIFCSGECNAFAGFGKSASQACKEIVIRWLRQPKKDKPCKR